MKRYFLGLAAHYSEKHVVLKHTFAHGTKKDIAELEEFLSRKYEGEAIACKNGRSALALALKAYFERGDKIVVNGFTCFAVFEAVKAAGLTPVFVDVNLGDLNFDEKALERAVKNGAKGIIIQNTLGNPANLDALTSLAKKHNLTLIEDLAHAAGIKYANGREAGMIGAAVAFSFGKDKSVDTVSGGAVVFREPVKHEIRAPFRRAKTANSLRARFYPLFGATTRGLNRIHLGGVFMRGLIKLHLVEKSADNRLDLEEKISKFEAKLALLQFKSFKKSGERPIREFYLVNNREEVLNELKKAGYYFEGFWYEKPIAPARYYKKVHFNEKECPNAVFAAEHIINFPTFYPKGELARAREIIKPYLISKEEK